MLLASLTFALADLPFLDTASKLALHDTVLKHTPYNGRRELQ
jgi:hypothetical protein